MYPDAYGIEQGRAELKAQQELLHEISGLWYVVEKTQCYPNEWFGGPAWFGQRRDNAACYYWRTEFEALEYALKMNNLLLEEAAKVKP